MSNATMSAAIVNADKNTTGAVVSTARTIGFETLAPRSPPFPGNARLTMPRVERRKMMTLPNWTMPKCFSKERRMARLVRRSERGSSIYPIPRSHESHSYKVAPVVPPLPKFARMRKPASAMKKTAMTPRIASVLIRGSASFSSFRRFFLSFRFPCLIGIHHTLEEGILHRNFFSREISKSLFATRRALSDAIDNFMLQSISFSTITDILEPTIEHSRAFVALFPVLYIIDGQHMRRF